MYQHIERAATTAEISLGWISRYQHCILILSYSGSYGGTVKNKINLKTSFGHSVTPRCKSGAVLKTIWLFCVMHTLGNRSRAMWIISMWEAYKNVISSNVCKAPESVLFRDIVKLLEIHAWYLACAVVLCSSLMWRVYGLYCPSFKICLELL